MSEILPIRVLREEDASIFGSLNVSLGSLQRAGISVGQGIVITAPEIKLRSVLEHYDFGQKQIFEQSLTLVKKEINSIPVPQILATETNKHKEFFVNSVKIKSVKNLWLELLNIWLKQIKNRLWNKGFYPGITEGLEPQIVIFIKELKSFGSAFFDPIQDDVEIRINSGKLQPSDSKKIFDLVLSANKKLFIPHEYEWIIDRGVKLTGIKPYTSPVILRKSSTEGSPMIWEDSSLIVQNDKTRGEDDDKKSAVKVFYELSTGFTIEQNVDGIYIDSGKIFDLNKPRESFEDMVLKLVESAVAFPDSLILFKLADMSEGMGKVRGTLRLLHQKSLFDPMVQALDFARHKKNLTNIHIVVPFVRGVNELLQIKRDLAVKKLSRKNSLGLWMEVAVPENIINMENYLIAGIDGVVLNLDELISHLNGFDSAEAELAFYKNEEDGLLKFMEDGLRLLHKSKMPFIAYGSLAMYPKVLEFLVEKGVTGIVAERYEAHSAHDLLYQVEKRMVLRKS